MPADLPDTPPQPADAASPAPQLGPPLTFSPRLARWHLGSVVAICVLALGVVLWPAAWPREWRGHLHTVLMVSMGASFYVQWRAGLLGLTPQQIYRRFRGPHGLFHRWYGPVHTLAGTLFICAAVVHGCTG